MKLGNVSGRSAGLFITGILAGLGSALAAGMKGMVEHAALVKSERPSHRRSSSPISRSYSRTSRSRYMPHQGQQEMARRRRHIAEGRLTPNYHPEA